MIPSAQQYLEKKGNGNGFVKMSVVILPVGIHVVTKVPSSIFLQMK